MSALRLVRHYVSAIFSFLPTILSVHFYDDPGQRLLYTQPGYLYDVQPLNAIYKVILPVANSYKNVEFIFFKSIHIIQVKRTLRTY